jgi:hypothetical protein
MKPLAQISVYTGAARRDAKENKKKKKLGEQK